MQAPQEEITSQRTEFVPANQVQLWDAFSYVFRGQGPWLLGVFVGFVTLMELIRFPVWLFIGGYLLAHAKRIICASSEGQREMPDWPDYINFFDDILHALVQLLVCLTLCLGPSLYFYTQGQWIPALLFGLIGVFWFPICALSVSLHNSLATLFNVHILFPSMLKLGVDYIIVVVILVIAVVMNSVLPDLVSWLPLLGRMISRLASFYLLATLANMIGLLYFKHAHKLDWF